MSLATSSGENAQEKFKLSNIIFVTNQILVFHIGLFLQVQSSF
jgi:hypothetical protein